MFLIVGLGNPGEKYSKNRHNIGFIFLDYLKEKYNFDKFKKKKNFLYSKNTLSGNEIICLKPVTFMNLSGNAVINAMKYFNIPVNNIVVVFDDIAIPFGKIRIRERGSDGGHNGLKNIREHLGTEEYKRIRIGIGNPDYTIDYINHVLGNFTLENLIFFKNNIFITVEDSVKLIINNQIKEAMNKYNGLNLSKD
jgi:PTH1 family peptidyl-tRNA hydrolase